jgi:NAD(P)-dependent dehydrogenase (short-subunit alcohol dehydrogenase family)
MAGFVRQSFIGAYNSSKAALDSFSEMLALEVAPFGVLHTIAASALPTNVLVAAAKKASDGRVGLSGS